MKKIGIMSMQRINNYGSFLQAYGLKKIIEGLGHDVQFVDYEYEKCIADKRKKRSIFEKLIYNINIMKFLKKKIIHKQFKEMYRDSLMNIGVAEKNIRPNIDSLVIGSDEVFNCLQPYPVGYSRELFGKNYENKNVISYAASFGHTSYEELIEYGIEDEIKQMLASFKAVSVRDNNSFEIASKLLPSSKININIDPVLLYNYSKEISKYKILEENYIIVYAYEHRLNSNEEKYIRKFAKKYNKKIISIGFYQRIADKNIVCDPFEMLAYIKNADFVITDTFHGSVFSIVNNTQFATIIRNSNKNKLDFLLDSLKLGSRKVNELTDIDILFNKKLDFNETNKIIEKEREKSIKYLNNNL